MKNLCIIPARGGSKRIPRKNIIDFLGKPLIAYSIENALNSGIFDEVVLSSDDEEIIEVALKLSSPFSISSNVSPKSSAILIPKRAFNTLCSPTIFKVNLWDLLSFFDTTSKDVVSEVSFISLAYKS